MFRRMVLLGRPAAMAAGLSLFTAQAACAELLSKSEEHILVSRARRIAECDTLDRQAYMSGLLFAPAGRKTFFKRSSCFQEAAIDLREEALCNEVIERKTFFTKVLPVLFAGHRISPEACRKEVSRMQEKDRSEAAKLSAEYQRGPRINGIHICWNDTRDKFIFSVHQSGSRLPGPYATAAVVQVDGKDFTLYNHDYSGSPYVSISRPSALPEGLIGKLDPGKEYPLRVSLRLVPLDNRFESQSVLSYLPEELRVAKLETTFSVSKVEPADRCGALLGLQ